MTAYWVVCSPAYTLHPDVKSRGHILTRNNTWLPHATAHEKARRHEHQRHCTAYIGVPQVAYPCFSIPPTPVVSVPSDGIELLLSLVTSSARGWRFKPLMP